MTVILRLQLAFQLIELPLAAGNYNKIKTLSCVYSGKLNSKPSPPDAPVISTVFLILATSQFDDVRLHIGVVVGKRLYAVCV